MIPGITIIEEGETLTDVGWFLLIMLTIFAVASIFIATLLYKSDYKVGGTIALIVGFISALLLAFSPCFFPTKPTYTVHIDDNVSKVEFDDHYREIDRHGDNYIIIKKEEDN